MTGDSIIYNFASIDSVAASINAFVSQMNNDLAEVDQTFKNLLANGWQGAGADAFSGCSARWHQSANQMAETLQRLSQKVGNAAVNMQQADNAAAARF